jgi:kynurenine formamidase
MPIVRSFASGLAVGRALVATGTSLMLACASAAPAPAAPAREAPAGSLGAALVGQRMVDLSHAFDQATLYWPTSPSGFQLTQLHHGPTAGGYFYASNSFCSPEHGGTHLDAPIHFAAGGASAEHVGLEHLVAPAVVVDLRERAEKDPDALLAPADLEAFEAASGVIAPGTIVLVHSGWSQRWPQRKAYFGDDTPGDASRLHFPGLSADAARALVERRVAAVGIDTASIDHGPSRDFMAHRVLMEADIPAFENLTRLAELPARGAWVIALPVKIAGGTGGPLRAIAVLP